MSGDPQGLVLRLVVINVFSGDMDGGIEASLQITPS